MSRKNFSLLGLLKVRSVQEQMAAEQLARANRKREHTTARENQIREALDQSPSSVTTSAEMLGMVATRAAAAAALSELKLLGEAQDVEVEAARTIHQAARIDERGLSRLAEAHDALESARELAEEQAELDEIAITSRNEDTL